MFRDLLCFYETHLKCQCVYNVESLLHQNFSSYDTNLILSITGNEKGILNFRKILDHFMRVSLLTETLKDHQQFLKRDYRGFLPSIPADGFIQSPISDEEDDEDEDEEDSYFNTTEQELMENLNIVNTSGFNCTPNTPLEPASEEGPDENEEEYYECLM